MQIKCMDADAHQSTTTSCDAPCSHPDKNVHDNDQVLQRALDCLSSIKGSFAFIIYDSVHHRVLAARDSGGAQPMYWGATGERYMELTFLRQYMWVIER